MALEVRTRRYVLDARMQQLPVEICKQSQMVRASSEIKFAMAYGLLKKCGVGKR